MKRLKNIFIGIGKVFIIITSLLVLPVIIGFVIVGILDTIGILNTKSWSGKSIISVSAILGALIFLLYYLITGSNPLE